MERFLSNAVNRIDTKGRVSVPAQFRSVLQLKGLSDLYALQAIDTAVKQGAYPEDELIRAAN